MITFKWSQIKLVCILYELNVNNIDQKYNNQSITWFISIIYHKIPIIFQQNQNSPRYSLLYKFYYI
jgi:hypothetical protein